MKIGGITLAIALTLFGCQPSRLKVLIGANAVVARGSAAVPDAIVVIAGPQIQAVGARRDVPVPQDSERIDLTGKFITTPNGGHLAPGEPATLEVREGSADGVVLRKMEAGEWQK